MDATDELLADAGLLVNTTSLGMDGEADACRSISTALPDHALVTDIVYVPLETPLLAAARARGLETVDGLGMLLHQAVPGFERWFGMRPEVTPELRDLIVADMAGKAAMIVLGLTGSIGMGKSTTAGMFADAGVPVHDSDEAVHRLYRGEAAPLVEAAFPGTTRRRRGRPRAARPSACSATRRRSKRLEAIVHPLVRADADAFLARHRAAGAPLVVLDIPLLFETGGRGPRRQGRRRHRAAGHPARARAGAAGHDARRSSRRSSPSRCRMRRSGGGPISSSIPASGMDARAPGRRAIIAEL